MSHGKIGVRLASIGNVLLATTSAGATTGAAKKPQLDVQTKETQSKLTPARALQKLEEGNARFEENRRLPRDLSAKMVATSAGQYPFAVIVSCMDSRAPVEIIFDQGIGDLFSLRVAGNVVAPDFLGSLEFATKVAGAKLILVLGHSECGAVIGAIDGVQLGNLTGLLARIEPAIKAAGRAKGSSKDPAYVARVAELNVRQAMSQIREQSPILKGLLDSGSIGLEGGMYDLTTGKVTIYPK